MRRKALVLALLLAACNSLYAADDLKRMEWKVDGVTREALIYAPATATTAPTPVIFAFHGHGGTMTGATASFGYHRLWPQAIAVYMQGLNTAGRLTDPEGKRPGWQHSVGNQGDRDLKFFDAVLATLKKDYRVDEKRIYATGHSNGGGFTYVLWAARGDVFAAVAPSAAAALIGDPPDNLPAALAERIKAAGKSAAKYQPKPVLHVAGEKDTLVKFEWQKLTIEALRRLNGCDAGKPWGEHCTIYPSKTGTPVVTYIHPGGHKSPADAPALIVKFFQEHSKP